MIPRSPLARGRLTRNWDDKSACSETDEFGKALYAKIADADRKIVDRVADVATRCGVPRARAALAWLLSRPVITAPIVGVTKLQHLDDALAAVGEKLSAEEIAALEEPYVPHAIAGFA